MKDLRLNIKTVYFDSDGILLDKNTIAEELKTPMPWYCFGKFDFDCNYKNATQFNQVSDAWKFIGIYTRNEIKFLFTGYNNIQNQMQNGDIGVLYSDSAINPTTYCYVVLSSNGSGLSGVVKNANLRCFGFNVDSSNPLEDYNLGMVFGKVDNLGTYSGHDTLSLSSHYSGMAKPNNNKIFVPNWLDLDENNWFSGKISFDTSYYFIDFKNIKIK